MEDITSCSSRAVNSLPAESRKLRQKIEVYHDLLRRLKDTDNEEASRPGFDDELWAHFNRLPLRYALDVNVGNAEDVLVHMKLLRMAYDPNTRIAFEVLPLQIQSGNDDSCSGSLHSKITKNVDPENSIYSGRIHPLPSPGLSSLELEIETRASQVPDRSSSWSAPLQLMRPLHEITISTYDKPKLLSQLTSLLSEVGLNIQEAHAFSTIDGYSLDVFVVDGWEYEETEQLRRVLEKEIPKIKENLWSNNHTYHAKLGRTTNMLIRDHVNIPIDGVDVWEIDAKMLKFEHKIAAGPFGDLYKGTMHSQDVAIKCLKPEYLKADMQREFVQEVYILRKVRHKNVVQFIGACTRAPNFYIVTEFMSGGSVYDFLHKQNGIIKLPALLKVALDVSKGMNYLHQNNIIHRDLKSANILINENEVVKIADFGVARVQTQTGVMTAETGTYRWMAPEVIEHRPYNHKADIFSFGIVLWELLTGKLPYENFTPVQTAVNVVREGLRPSIPTHTHPLIVALLERCWLQDPSLRPEFSEIIEILRYIAKTVVEERPTKRRNYLAESSQLPVGARDGNCVAESIFKSVVG